MAITIKVRQSTGAYQARAMRLGVTASSAEGPKAAAIAVCRKLGIDPALLEQCPNQPQDSSFTHPNHPGEPRP
ncbi:hypothetical protein [Pseudomonas farris]